MSNIARCGGGYFLFVFPRTAGRRQPPSRFFYLNLSKYLLLSGVSSPFRLRCKCSYLFLFCKLFSILFSLFMKLFPEIAFLAHSGRVYLLIIFSFLFLLLIRPLLIIYARAYLRNQETENGMTRSGRTSQPPDHQPPGRRAYSTPQRTPADAVGCSEAPGFLLFSGLKMQILFLYYTFLIEKFG